MESPHQPAVATGISAVTASISLAAWSTDHAAIFAVIAACAAIISGLAGAVFYGVSTFYKIKYASRNEH